MRKKLKLQKMRRIILMTLKLILSTFMVLLLVIFTPMKIVVNWLTHVIKQKLFIVSLGIFLLATIVISCKSIHTFSINADSIENPQILYKDSLDLTTPIF